MNDILRIAKEYDYPIFKSNNIFNYNLNIWGFRSDSKDTTSFNDLCVVFYQNRQGHWFLEYFDITTDPSDLTLMNPININGTAILCEGYHKSLWTFGFHKHRSDHKALIQHSPCTVYRDNNRDKEIDELLPRETGMFGIEMHRASKYGTTPKIGLYSAGCQVHADVVKYDQVFIPLVENCVNEGNSVFSYTLVKESDLQPKVNLDEINIKQRVTN